MLGIAAEFVVGFLVLLPVNVGVVVAVAVAALIVVGEILKFAVVVRTTKQPKLQG